MKLITRDTDYAFRALSYIAKKNNTVVPVSEIQKNTRIPRPFLRKILQILDKKRILASFKGKGGGFKLKVSPVSIRLSDLIEIFTGPISLCECLLRKKRCPNTDICNLRKEIIGLEKDVVKRLNNITVGGLL